MACVAVLASACDDTPRTGAGGETRDASADVVARDSGNSHGRIDSGVRSKSRSADAASSEYGSARRDGGRPASDAQPDANLLDAAEAGKEASARIVLFDGSSAGEWLSTSGGAVAWPVTSGYIEVAPMSGDIHTKETFRSFSLHVEFWVPAKKPSDTAYSTSMIM